MKLTKEQQILQDLWDDVRSAYNKCPQTRKYEERCPYDSVYELIFVCVEEVSIRSDSLYHILNVKGYNTYLSQKTLNLIIKYQKGKINLLKSICEEYENETN